MRNYILAFASMALFVLAACNGSSKKESKTTNKSSLTNAEKIHNNTSFDVLVFPDTESYIEISGPSYIVNKITFKEVEGVLEISHEGTTSLINEKVEISVHTPIVGELHVNGSGSLLVQSKFSGDAKRINLRVNGSGMLKALVNTPAIDAVLVGSGDLEIIGETKELNLSVKGSGNYKGYNLLSETTIVNVSGSGNAKVYGSTLIDATVNGSGNIYYIGTGNLNKSLNGSGEIIKGKE
jgi:Putative auto-transporter adhesin, head GIN domain